MTIERKEIQIGERRFAVTQLPAMRSLKMATRLGRLFGPTLAQLATASPNPAALSELNVSALSPAIATFFDKLDEKEIESLTRDLLASAQIEDGGKWVELFGASPTFDHYMSGAPLDAFKLLYFAVEANYHDFFGAFRGAFAARAKTVRDSKGSNISPQPGPVGG